jgi:hypothetical protein
MRTDDPAVRPEAEGRTDRLVYLDAYWRAANYLGAA